MTGAAFVSAAYLYYAVFNLLEQTQAHTLEQILIALKVLYY